MCKGVRAVIQEFFAWNGLQKSDYTRTCAYMEKSSKRTFRNPQITDPIRLRSKRTLYNVNYQLQTNNTVGYTEDSSTVHNWRLKMRYTRINNSPTKHSKKPHENSCISTHNQKRRCDLDFHTVSPGAHTQVNLHLSIPGKYVSKEQSTHTVQIRFH